MTPGTWHVGFADGVAAGNGDDGIIFIDGLRKTGDAPGHKIFPKMLFFDNFWLLKPPKTKKGRYPPHPPSTSKILRKLPSQKHGHFWSSRRVRGVIF